MIVFKKLWNKIDGYKTIFGLITSGVGGLMYLTPVTAPFATEVLLTGLSTTAGGLTHKAVKLKKRKGDKNE